MFPLVSCIVPTKNSEEFLRECLESLVEQTYPNLEIIIVDNFSTDRTKEIAEEYGFISDFYQVGPERATQDNFGILKAKGEIIYLTGSDITRDETFIEEGIERIIEGYDAIYMSVLTDKRVKHYWGKVKALERLTYVGSNLIESTRFFRKSVWQMLGGFDDKLVQIEEDFQHRLDNNKFSTSRIKAREYHLHEEDSLWKVFKKSYYYGSFMKHYLKKHKNRGVKQLAPLRPCFFTHWNLFLKHPLLTLGFVVYKAVQYTGGILGMLSGKGKNEK